MVLTSRFNGDLLPEPIIAIILDFDDTVANDTTELFLREKLAMSRKQIEDFWNIDVMSRIKKGWDPPLAYIGLILERIQEARLRISNDELRALGSEVKLYDGVEDLFDRLKSFIRNNRKLQKAHIQIEFYVISGGFEEIIRVCFNKQTYERRLRMHIQ